MVGAHLTIAVDDGRIAATAVRWGRTLWAAEATWTGDGDLAAALAALAGERPRGVCDAVVVLGPRVARVKEVPALARLKRTDLAAHVRLHSRRYFLQNGVPLVTDARPLRTSAQLAAVHAPLVAAVCDGLAAAGLACADIFPAGTRGLSLLPEAERAGRTRRARRELMRWSVAAAGAIGFAALAWVAAMVRTERAARAELTALQPALSEARSVRRDLDAATEALALLAGSVASRSHRAALLASLATALPDSAFLVGLRVEPNAEVQLIGYAVRAPAVLAALERARLVQAPRFEGPVTREAIAGRDWERFTVRARLP